MGRTSKNFRVVAYRLDGSLFRVYESAKKASLSRKGHPRTIDKCIRGDSLTAFGYMWRRYPSDQIPETIEPLEDKKVSNTNTPIALLDDNGNILKHYPSINLAAKDNEVDPHSIRDVLNKIALKAKGKKYRYLTKKEIEKYGYQIHYKKNQKKCAIIQYTLNGDYVKTYPSINSANKALGKSKSNQGIKQCLSGQFQTAFGYVWKYKDFPNVSRTKRKMIYQYDLDKKLIKKYVSVKEASNSTKISISSINSAIRGRQATAGGYIWKRL